MTTKKKVAGGDKKSAKTSANGVKKAVAARKRVVTSAAKKPMTKSPAAKATSRAVKVAKSVAPAEDVDVWNLRLYVAGQTPKSLSAFTNLKRVCELHLPGRYKIEVIDLLKDPHLAQNDQILAIPTLVRKIPAPMKKIIGDLSNIDRFLIGFDLKPVTG